MSVVQALVGGALIGIAASLMLYLNGQVAGVSGILKSAILPGTRDRLWRLAFLVGLILGGVVLLYVFPQAFFNSAVKDYKLTALAGLLVGIGTAMGSGCTSGHGICGVSRLSKRSIFATFVFMAVGFLVASL